MGDKQSRGNIDEQRYRVLIDNAPEGVLIYNVDSNRFIDANQAAIDLLLFSREELLQLNIADVISPEQDDEVFGLSQAMAYIQQAIEGGNPAFEWIHIDRNGREIPCEIRLIRFPPYDKSIVRASVIDLTDKKRVEQAFAESEERLKLALKTTGLGYYDWSPQTNLFHWDARMHELFDLSPSDPIDRNEFFFQCLHPEDRKRIQQRFQNIMQPEDEQLTFETEFQIIRAGSIAHMVFTGVLIRDAKGEVQRLIGTAQDITERRQTELALRESEARYKSLVKHFPSGIISLFDQNLRYTLVDGERVKDIKSSIFPPVIVGKRLRDMFSKEIYEKYEPFQRAALAGEKSERIILMGPHYYAVSTLPVRDAQGKITAGLEVSQDITTLIKTEKKLNKTLEQLQLTIQTARLGVWQYVFATDQLDYNDRLLEIYGILHTSQKLSRKSWKEYVHPDDRAFMDQQMEELMKGNEVNELEFRIKRPDGTIRYVKAVSSLQRDETGLPLEMIGANWDITSEKEAEQEQIRARQLELRNRELEQFAYVASHDLQEPLRTVISFVGLLKRGYKDLLDQQANDYLQFVVEASSRMSQLIKGLLEYSRIGINRELSLVDTTILVQQILNDLSAQINSTQATIEVDQLPLIEGYETEMRMLFQNLISNAIKFRKPYQHPRIKIDVKEEKKMWVFSVADDGIGIDAAYKDQIFVLFQRLHGRAKYEGTGIGLAHCQKIVDLHGGTIWLESELDKGSTFFFSITKSKKGFE